MTTKAFTGTPAYPAPEQLSGDEAGSALDVFAWVSTVAFAATGRPPFGDGSPLATTFDRFLNEEPDLDGIEAPLRSLLVECLTKDPARRPSARRILEHLIREGKPVPGLRARVERPGPQDRPTALRAVSDAPGPGRSGEPGTLGRLLRRVAAVRALVSRSGPVRR
ncbi:serine/threonine protein kinase [Streptosporangium becharense]|uniref:Serine/threonine protein kinase n=1 Tax=Streptosporangium becharense TaxID=1816182 RepID=A0A7W9IJJ3_9ACTN|nr:serine/threonine protein kinase [Streptosporangium becharense]MBB5821880.1 serine/threonine protein kinase [Streptosporangium becharense]